MFKAIKKFFGFGGDEVSVVDKLPEGYKSYQELIATGRVVFPSGLRYTPPDYVPGRGPDPVTWFGVIVDWKKLLAGKKFVIWKMYSQPVPSAPLELQTPILINGDFVFRPGQTIGPFDSPVDHSDTFMAYSNDWPLMIWENP